MSLRQTLLELAARHQLDHRSTTELELMAGLRGQPSWLPARLPQAVAVAGSALFGLGLIFWIASNWDGLGRFGRIGMMQGAVALGLLAAWLLPSIRTVAALFAFLAIGGLFACIGQTYQTGADPWQLFALWIALTLPLCLALRSEVLWMPWIMVAATAIGLWLAASDGGSKHGESYLALALSWLLYAALPAMMLPPFRAQTGSGGWSLRLATLLSMSAIMLTGVIFALHEGFAELLLPLAITGAAIVILRRYDLPALSMTCLAFACLLVVSFARLLHLFGIDGFYVFMIAGLFAIGVMAFITKRLLAMHKAGGKA